MRFILMLVMLSAVIAVHELGHAVAMCAYDVPVKEFSIGVGPALWQTEVGEATTVSVHLLPLGGYTMPDEEAIVKLEPLPLVVIFVAGMALSVLVAFILLAAARGACYEEPFMLKGAVHRSPARLRPMASAFLDTFVGWPVFATVMMYDIVFRPGRFFAGVVTPIAMLGGAPRARADSAPDDQAPKPPAPFSVRFAEPFCAFTVGFAACNFLPFAPLDGAKIVAIGIENAFGDAAAASFLTLSSAAFFALIILLVLSDLRKLNGMPKRP